MEGAWMCAPPAAALCCVGPACGRHAGARTSAGSCRGASGVEPASVGSWDDLAGLMESSALWLSHRSPAAPYQPDCWPHVLSALLWGCCVAAAHGPRERRRRRVACSGLGLVGKPQPSGSRAGQHAHSCGAAAPPRRRRRRSSAGPAERSFWWGASGFPRARAGRGQHGLHRGAAAPARGHDGQAVGLLGAAQHALLDRVRRAAGAAARLCRRAARVVPGARARRRRVRAAVLTRRARAPAAAGGERARRRARGAQRRGPPDCTACSGEARAVAPLQASHAVSARRRQPGG